MRSDVRQAWYINHKSGTEARPKREMSAVAGPSRLRGNVAQSLIISLSRAIIPTARFVSDLGSYNTANCHFHSLSTKR
jgi:hypothetical protein